MFITKRFLFDVEDEDVLKLFLDDLRDFTEYKVDMEYREIQLPKDVKRMSSRRGRIPKDVQWKFLDLLMCLCSLDHWKFVSHQTLSNIYYTSRGELFVLPDAFKFTETPKMENAVILVSALATELKNFADVYECVVAAEELKLVHITNPVASERFLNYRGCLAIFASDKSTPMIALLSSPTPKMTMNEKNQSPFPKKQRVLRLA
jgi:hypothetical protein